MSENFQKVKAYLQELELPTETEDEAEELVVVNLSLIHISEPTRPY